MRSSFQRFVKKRMGNSNDGGEKQQQEEQKTEDNNGEDEVSPNNSAGDDLSPKVGAGRKRKKPKDKVRSMNAAVVSDDDNSLLGILGASKQSNNDTSIAEEEEEAPKKDKSEKATSDDSPPKPETKPEETDGGEETAEVSKVNDPGEPSNQPKEDSNPQNSIAASSPPQQKETNMPSEETGASATSPPPTKKSAKDQAQEEESSGDEYETSSSGEYETSSGEEESEYESTDDEEEEEESSEYESTDDEEEEESSEEEEEEASDQTPKAVSPPKTETKSKETTAAEPEMAEVPKVEKAPIVNDGDAPEDNNDQSDQPRPPLATSPTQQETKPEEPTDGPEETAEVPSEASTDEAQIVKEGEASDQSEDNDNSDQQQQPLAVAPTQQETKSEEPNDGPEETEAPTNNNVKSSGEKEEEVPAAEAASIDEAPIVNEGEASVDQPEEDNHDNSDQQQQQQPLAVSSPTQQKTKSEEPTNGPKENTEVPPEASTKAPIVKSSSEKEEEEEEESDDDDEEEEESEEESSEYESSEEESGSSEYESTEDEADQEEEEEAPDSHPTPKASSAPPQPETKSKETTAEPETVEVSKKVEAPIAKKDPPEDDDSDQQQAPQVVSPAQQEAKSEETTTNGPEETAVAPTTNEDEDEDEADQPEDNDSDQQPPVANSPTQQEAKSEETTPNGPEEETAEVPPEASMEATISNEDEADQPEDDKLNQPQPLADSPAQQETQSEERTPNGPEEETAEVPPEASTEATISNEDEADHPEDNLDQPAQQETKSEETSSNGPEEEIAEVPPEASTEAPTSDEGEAGQPEDNLDQPAQQETKSEETSSNGPEEEIAEVPPEASTEAPTTNEGEADQPEHDDLDQPAQQETKSEETSSNGPEEEIAEVPPESSAETDASPSPTQTKVAEDDAQNVSDAGEIPCDGDDDHGNRDDHSAEKFNNDHDDHGNAEESKEIAVSEIPQDESAVAETSSASVPFTINDNLEIVSESDHKQNKEVTEEQDDIRNWLPQKIGNNSKKELQDNVQQEYDASSSDSESTGTEEVKVKTAPSDDATPDSDDMYTASSEEETPNNNKSAIKPLEEPDHSEVNENNSDSSEEEGTSDEESSEEEPDVEAARAKLQQGEKEGGISIPANVESIEIAAEANSIPASAFENCQQLKFVTYPPHSKVQSIGEGAFFKCESLMEMHFPQHLEIIADEAFLGCVELRKVSFASPETLQRIEKYAFFGCKQLLEIGLPEDFDRIGRNAFYGCFKLNPYPKTADPKIFIYTGEDDGELDVPEDVTHVRIGNICEVIPKKTFMYRHQLIQVDFRNAKVLKTIEKHAFYRCDNLRDVSLSSTPLQSIGQKAFFGCKSLTSIYPPKSLTLVDGDALNFSGYYLYRGDTDEMVPPDMKQVRVGSSVSTLQKEVFVQCEKLQEVKLTDAVRLTSIGEEAFYYSEALAEISLPDNVRIIERAAFLGCSGLAKVSLNTNLEIIGEEAFEACTSLRMIALSENVQVIGDSAFYACAKLKTVRVNDLLKVIGEEAFMLCKALANITLPSGLDSLGENAFDQCPGLEWIDLSGPDNLPLAMHIRVQYEDEAGEKLKMASLVEMYSKMPIDTSELISDSEEELQLLEEIKAAYMLIELDRIARIPNRAKDVGFVRFLSHHVDHQTAESLAGFLRASNIETVQRLANAKDNSGNSALQVAPPPVLRAFQDRLMFLGRYDLQEETVVRKSDNAIVVEALDYKMEEFYEEGFDRWSLAETLDDELFCRALEDLLLIPLENSFAVSKDYFQIVDHMKNGEISKESFLSFCTEQFGRKVVLKFIRHEDQYQRELDRNALDLDRRYILGMLRHHDKRDTPGMAEALPGFIGAHLSDRESASDYCHLIVLPRGDKNLETIYRYEKPDGVEIKSLLREVGKALSHLHDNGLVHGNLRMSKIIRQNGHVKLSDMAASALIGSEPLGLKVSSGVLPPEMIHGILSSSGCQQLEEYYQNASPKTRANRAPKISHMPTQMWCVVRAFLTDKKGKGGSFVPRTEGLPYELLQASASADVWSFGGLIYACCTGHSLFKVDYRDSVEDGNSLRVLWDWNDLDLEASLVENVENEATKDILRSILQRDESLRPSMKEVLRHPFFDPDTRMQDWQSTSTAPTATPHHDYVTVLNDGSVLNDELKTPQIRNKKSVSSSQLKGVLKVSNSLSAEEETISLLEYNELSQEVENLRGALKNSMVSTSKSEDDSVTLSEYKRLSDEVALLKEELKKSQQDVKSVQGLNRSPTVPNHNVFHDVEVVCKGWLQKRRYDKRSLWKNRYFVSYEDGTVTYYRNAAELNDPTKGGCAFHLVRFHKPDEESLDTFELQTLQGEPIMQLRLSRLTISTVEDWLGAKQREDNSVVHKGWLQKQSRKHNQLWNDRYFLLSKTGSVVYYASATDANNPSAGGATFPRVKWEHITDTTKKEDFDLKTTNGELIMKLRLSKLSSSSIDDWMKGNEWYKKSNHAASPASNDNIANDFEPVPGSTAPDAIVYENEVATFSGISEMGHTYDEIRLSGNIAVPQEVNAMEAIHEKKESIGEGISENQIVNEIGDALPEEEPENVSSLSLSGSHEKKVSSGEGQGNKKVVDVIDDGLPDEEEGESMKEPENLSSQPPQKQGANEDESREKKEGMGEELGDRQIVDELGDALPDEEENEIKENPNDANHPLEEQGTQGEPRETKETTGEELGDREIVEELGDALPDEDEYKIKENPNDATPLNDTIIENDDDGAKKPTGEEESSKIPSDVGEAIQENQDLNDPNEIDIKGGQKNAGAIQELIQAKDDSPADGDTTTNGNEGLIEVAEEGTKDSGAIQDVEEKDDPPNNGGIAKDRGEDIPPATEEKQMGGEPEKDRAPIQDAQGKESGDITVDNSGEVQATQEETKGTDAIQETADAIKDQETQDGNKDIANGISKAFQLFKRKVVKREPKEVDDVEQSDKNVSVVDEDPNVSYDYDSVLPERFDGHPRANQALAPVSTVNFAGEVQYRSDDEVSGDFTKSKPDDEVSQNAKPGNPKGKNAAQKLGEKIPKLVSQFSEKLQLEVKAKRKKRREKMKTKKRLRALSYESSSASEGVVKRSSM